MKKIKAILCTLVVLLLIPFTVFADSKEKINVYIFKGDGCGFCAKALTFFEGLDEEYKSYFNLVEKEVWYDEDNANLMEKVADYFNEDVTGVPYIIIGEKTFKGFDEEKYGDQIKSLIKTSYENSDGSYKDVVSEIIGGQVIEKSNNSAVTIIVIIVAVAGVGFLVYMARDEEEPEENEVKTKTKTTTTKKKTTKKKVNKK